MLELSARIEELERERAQFEDFAAMAAHELLQPLVMTEAYATQVSERAGHGLDLNSRHDLDAIVRISARVRMLVDGLLVSARETGRPLHREQVDLTEVIRDCVRMLGTEIATRNAHLDIDPMPVVEGDPVLLSGVFSNLLSNALKYGPRSGGDIHVSAVRSEAGWTFAVQSLGPAIAEEGRERIFEAVGARSRRAPRQGRRPRARDRPPHHRAPRRPRRGHVAERRQQPLLLHAARLTRLLRRAAPAAHALSDGHRLLARACVELAQDVLDVRADRL